MLHRQTLRENYKEQEENLIKLLRLHVRYLACLKLPMQTQEAKQFYH